MKLSSSLILVTCGVFVAAGGPSGYRMTNQVLLPGAGGWDYLRVDVAARRVYVSHSTQVEVLDADTQKSVGTIADTPGVHGIALAPELGRGFISAGKADAVVIFDLKTLRIISQVKTGKKPDAIVFDPETKLIFNSLGEGSIAVFRQDSPDRYTPVQNIQTAEGAKTMALDSKTHRLFVPSLRARQFTILVFDRSGS